MTYMSVYPLTLGDIYVGLPLKGLKLVYGIYFTLDSTLYRFALSLILPCWNCWCTEKVNRFFHKYILLTNLTHWKVQHTNLKFYSWNGPKIRCKIYATEWL